MAASTTPRKPDAQLLPVVAVAYSAGRDSTALLHATARCAAGLGAKVVALHVHHGLSPHADAWLSAAQAQCSEWAARGWPVSLAFTRLQGRPSRGESVEAWARQARYRALRAMALEAGATVVLLAHHRRDQAETFLLQALRGAGVSGLAGMPAQIERGGLVWMRPWLNQPREMIDAYVKQHGLRHVEDDSNADARFARNRLRLEVWPAMHGAFEQAEAGFADAARWAAEASACLAELADLDLAVVADARGLQVDAWCLLSPARRANALRIWLRRFSGHPVPAALIQRLMRELPGTGSAQWTLGALRLRRHRGRLLGEPAQAVGEGVREDHLSIRRAGRVRLPGWGGALVATRVKEGGVPLAWLAHLELRAREGGEQFQAGFGRPPRSLKKQFQAADVPAWARQGPLVYSGGQLVYVPGLGMDARVIALPGQPQLSLSWHNG